MKPRKQEVAQKNILRPTYSGLPEHNFRLKREEWEMVVFDNATNFAVSWFRGRFNHGRDDFGGDFLAAIISCEANPRACLYASCDSGRTVCLDRKDFSALAIRWEKNRE